MGSEVIRDQQTVLLFGILIFSIFVALIAINRKNLELDRFAKWYGLLAFGVLTSLELVVTRSGDIANYFGPPEKIFFLPSYRHYPVVFLPLICVYSLSILYSTLSEENKGMIKTSANAFLKTMLFTLLICSFILNFFPGIKTGEHNFVSISERSAILKTYDVQPDENLKKLHLNPEIVKKRAKKLEELRLSVFAENNILLYKPDEVKLLPKQSQLQGVLRIYNDVKFVLFQHPISNENRSIIVFNEIYIPQNAKLRFSIALHPDVWDPEKGDGVTFEVYIRDEGFEELVFSKYIDPKHNPEERKWNDFEVDLSRYAGRNVTIIFSTLPGPNNDSRWDWAWWGEPRIEW